MNIAENIQTNALRPINPYGNMLLLFIAIIIIIIIMIIIMYCLYEELIRLAETRLAQNTLNYI